MRLPTNSTLEPLLLLTRDGTAPVREERKAEEAFVWLIPTKRSVATQTPGSMHLAEAGEGVVAVAQHNFLPISAVARVSDEKDIIVTLEGPLAESGRSTLIRVWTLESCYCRAVIFEPRGGFAVAVQKMGRRDGLPVAGLSLVSLVAPGDEY